MWSVNSVTMLHSTFGLPPASATETRTGSEPERNPERNQVRTPAAHRSAPARRRPARGWTWSPVAFWVGRRWSRSRGRRRANPGSCWAGWSSAPPRRSARHWSPRYAAGSALQHRGQRSQTRSAEWIPQIIFIQLIKHFSRGLLNRNGTFAEQTQ